MFKSFLRKQYRGNILKIHSVKKEDRGTYYCVADNGVGKSARRNVAVEVEFPPDIQGGGQVIQNDVCRVALAHG